MYGTKNTTPRFYPAISNNCELQAVNWENTKKDGSGQMVLTFHFINSNGGQFRWCAFPVNETKVLENNKNYPFIYKNDDKRKRWKAGETRSDEQAIENAYDELSDQVSQVLNTYMNKEQAAMIETKSYEDYTKQVISKLEGKYSGVKINLYLTLNKKNFLQVPRFGNFIELSSNVPSKLEIRKGDRVTYPQADLESATVSIDNDETADDGVDNLLPF